MIKAGDVVGVNLNDYVRVKLTDYGEAHLKMVRYSKKPNADGIYQFMLWDLMYIFGPKMILGGPAVFEGGKITIIGS